MKHIRINNKDGVFSMGKTKDTYDSIWDLIEAQLDKSLKSSKAGDTSVQLM